MDEPITISKDAYKDMMAKLMTPVRRWLAGQVQAHRSAEAGTYLRGRHDAFLQTLKEIDQGLRTMK